MAGLPGQLQSPGTPLLGATAYGSSQPGGSPDLGSPERLLSPITDSPPARRRALALPAINNYRPSRPASSSGHPDSSFDSPPRYDTHVNASPPLHPSLAASPLAAQPVAFSSPPPTGYGSPTSNQGQQQQQQPQYSAQPVLGTASWGGQAGQVAGGALGQAGPGTAAWGGQAGHVAGGPGSPAGGGLQGSGISRLRVHVVTYNMAGTLPAGTLPGALFGDEVATTDLFVIGTQESCALGDWERLIARSLGSNYVKKAQESLMSISLLVYAHIRVAARLTEVRTSSIACGVGNVLGNKGAVGVSCALDGARLLLITSHLAAHDDFIERRNADYQRIYDGLFSASSTTGNVPVAANPGERSGSVTPQRQESPQRSAPGSGDYSAAAGGSPPYNQSPSLGAGSNPRISRFAHVSSMSQMPQPLSWQGSQGSLDRASGSDSASTAAPGMSPLASLSQGSIPREGIAQTDIGSPLLGPLTVGPKQSALPLHDVVLWGGDLNYRINGAPAAIKQLLGSDMIEVLHANDQLRLQMRKGKVFQGFHEQAIHFPPTFKYRPGTTTYSDKRIPSWTDRVLHTAYAHESACALEPLYYRDVAILMDSDHRPVVAGYELTVNPQFATQRAHNTSSQGCNVS